MRKIVCVSDSHGRHKEITLPNGDFLIHAGDFSRGKGSILETIDFLKWLESLPYKHRIAIAGNHDAITEDSPDLFASLFKEHAPSCHYLCDSGIELDGYKIWGSPVTPTFYNWWWNRNRGPEIMRHWQMIPEDTQILVTHGPPRGILDLVPDGSHQGCLDLKEVINKRLKNLKLHVFGHLHSDGNQQVTQNNVTYVNAAVVGEDYRLRGKIQVIEI